MFRKLGVALVAVALVLTVTTSTAEAATPRFGAVFNNPMGKPAAKARLMHKIVSAIRSSAPGSYIRIAAYSNDRKDVADALLAAHKRQLDAARDEAQKLITKARADGEKVRADVIEQAHREQQQMLERARAEIISERDRATAVLRRETVDLAVRAASKVIERNLDAEANRAVVESFLASIAPAEAKR